jgi:hypothetical protein
VVIQKANEPHILSRGRPRRHRSLREPEMNEHALGERRLRVWERLLILPLTNGDGQCNRLWCYGAYQSLAPAHIPLRPWAEELVRE